jgi:glycosyltransferase involved in cell wall biosynthesis
MLLILESHPIQYRVPVYQCMERLRAGACKVIFGTDGAASGQRDPGFGREVKWDVPLLTGYAHEVLHNQRGGSLEHRASLHGRGVFDLLRREHPAALLLNGLVYHLDFAAYFAALRLGIPVWLRSETQDTAFARPAWKTALRRVCYRALYRPLQRAFFIGELNRRHLLRHGVRPERLRPARYCVADPLRDATTAEKSERRRATRQRLGLRDAEIVVAFFGKLIAKKNPDLLLAAAAQLPEPLGSRVRLMFVGSGEMEAELRAAGSNALFTGFINQSELADHYLAADIVVLPSRRMGETWGLVVNEALQAGCAAVVSDAVGCAEEFKTWDRVRVFPAGDAAQLAQQLAALAALPREFDWCRAQLADYSIEAAARALLEP